MVSALWKAASEGDLQAVNEFLEHASALDIELKDHTGVTPLIEAIKNGHVDVVRALLGKGADPSNGSSQGRPDQYTSDPTILGLLEAARSKMPATGLSTTESTYPTDSINPEKAYYGPPPGYPYFPTLNGPPPTLPDGTLYYPPPHPHPSIPQANGDHSPGVGGNNLPPPDIARFIPCRYFPACRYGSSCIFAHPQTPYFQGPVPPPAQYPPYDPMTPHPYPPAFYSMPPPPPPGFHGTNGVHPMNALSPGAPPLMAHGRSPSELVSPSQAHFNPSGPPVPPYGPLTPAAYSQPHVPQTIPVPPVSAHPHQPLVNGPTSPSILYPNPPAPFPVLVDSAGQYPLPPPAPQANATPKYNEFNGDNKASPPTHQQDNFVSNIPPHRDNHNNHHRRGTPRRISLRGRGLPACIFFPLGRCKNGDDCRFPHVVSDGPVQQNGTFFNGRGGGPRPRGPPAQFGAIDEKFANMSVHDDPPRSSQLNGPKYGQPAMNGARINKNLLSTKQRVPNADEFPVLGGSTTPPTRSGVNGLLNGQVHAGPTAAQVLQAPAPVKKEPAKDVRVSPSEAPRPVPSKEKNERIGISSRASSPSGVAPPIAADSVDIITENGTTEKVPTTFAAAIANGVHKGVSVSA